MQVEHDGKTYRLRKLSNSPNYYVETRDQGRPVRFSTGCTDEKEAQQFLTAFIRDLSKPEAPGTIPQILDYYYEEYAKEKASAEQAAIYIKHLKRIIGGIKPEELTVEVQRDYIKARKKEHLAAQVARNKERSKKGLTPSPEKPISSETLNRELTVLSAAIRFYYDSKNIQYAPPRIKLLPRKRPRDKWLTRSQMAQLLWALRKGGYPAQHLVTFVRLGLYSGPRPGQITSLTWDRVDFENRAIWYFDPEDEETNKRAEVVDMDDRIYRMLQTVYRKGMEAEARAEKRGARDARRNLSHVIEHRGQPVQKVTRAFKRYTEALGWHGVTPNTLRHTFATHAARNANEVDLTLMDLMKAMGHSSIKTTMRYAKHMPGQHRKVLQAARKKKK